jgi:hypothetical protein
MKSKTISIWSPLRYANYGDDMQAIAFARFLQELGYNVKLFQLDEDLAKLYQLESCPTVDDLCTGVNLVVIAGGALLGPNTWYERILSRTPRLYERDFGHLLQAEKKYPNVKFCAISFGGDGHVHDALKMLGRNRAGFLSSEAFIGGTVRLQGDVEMMKILGKDVSYYADMLFQAPKFFPPQMLPPTEKYRVGFNFKKGRHLDQKLLHDILEYAETHDDMEFHFTTTHLEKIGMKYQYIPEKESNNIFIDQYENLEQLLGVLASMDCFMTSMLHVGLTGLTTGTPFISYRGPGKTKTFLRSIGGEWAIMPENITFDELKSKVWSQSREALYNKYNTAVIEDMKKDSLNQYEYCKMIAEKYA